MTKQTILPICVNTLDRISVNDGDKDSNTFRLATSVSWTYVKSEHKNSVLQPKLLELLALRCVISVLCQLALLY